MTLEKMGNIFEMRPGSLEPRFKPGNISFELLRTIFCDGERFQQICLEIDKGIWLESESREEVGGGKAGGSVGRVWDGY